MADTLFGERANLDGGGGTLFSSTQTTPQAAGFNNFGNPNPVTKDIWIAQVAFDRDGTGQNRETITRTQEVDKWYTNYVQTWNAADDATRNAIDIQHGFATQVASPVVATPAATPEASTSTPLVARIAAAADAPREEITPTPGAHAEGAIGGLEDTNVVNRVYDDDLEEQKVINNLAPITPLDVVVDPNTGQEYDSPADARNAGVTNWVYKSSLNATGTG